MARRGDIDGLRRLERDMRRLGQVPQKVANKAARAGAAIARKAAKSNAPVDTGQLKKGVIMKAERKVKPGKKVYGVMIDPKMNDVFVKLSKTNKRSYYPASQEYGWTTNGHYTPGYRYLRHAIENNADKIEKQVIQTAGKEIDKILSERG
ncbi:HK97-gp10 family putative phage morphogenesis protein [Paenibacillus sp. GCM10023248]|uniref:HK97-gp10 family putative phage morphogenesis protein n=1 Tax=unclassified Paenibacillus TaxID=185978 RepID=UPI0023799D74|nr:HK97-gp10 family putative phage morphogenesis protein [Paenibacillus sp. MAHUQ-63]MDD9266054.1 HK97 gp10 family phage protein [Paenibacillus sp. MAHUQ-63]